MTNAIIRASAFQSLSSASSGSVVDNLRAFPVDRVRATIINHRPGEWTRILGERFNVLTSLPRGWDGYLGRPVTFTCANFAAQLLEKLFDEEVPPPSLVPGADGSIQIEWHLNQYDIEIDVLRPYQVVASRLDCLSGDIEEVELETNFRILSSWISDLKNVRVGGFSVAVAN